MKKRIVIVKLQGAHSNYDTHLIVVVNKKVEHKIISFLKTDLFIDGKPLREIVDEAGYSDHKILKHRTRIIVGQVIEM